MSEFITSTMESLTVPGNNDNNIIPVGTILPFGGSVPPPGWLLCQGQSVSKLTYSKLFGVLGHLWGGSGDIFQLPNFQGASPVGANLLAVGATGGSLNHTHTKQHNHSVPSHSHSISGSHNHTQGSHIHTISPHTHTGAHSHNVAHSHSIASHSHANATTSILSGPACGTVFNDCAHVNHQHQISFGSASGSVNSTAQQSESSSPTLNGSSSNTLGPSTLDVDSASCSASTSTATTTENATPTLTANGEPYFALNFIIRF
jgi:microcystin-dependent protein